MIDASKSPYTAAMAAKLQTDKGKTAYRRRKWIAEPPNGWIKSVLGFRQFSLRGLQPRASRVQARVPGAESAPQWAVSRQHESCEMSKFDPQRPPQGH